MWGLVLRIVKWSAFIVLFTVAASPRTHSVPDPAYLCIEQTCYNVVKSPAEQGDAEQANQNDQRHY
jgi:hypothetical protein